MMTHAHAFSVRWPLTSTGMQATGATQRCVAAATNYVTEHVRLSAKQLCQSQAYVSVVSNTACGILSVMQSFDVRVFVLLFCVLP